MHVKEKPCYFPRGFVCNYTQQCHCTEHQAADTIIQLVVFICAMHYLKKKNIMLNHPQMGPPR